VTTDVRGSVCSSTTRSESRTAEAASWCIRILPLPSECTTCEGRVDAVGDGSGLRVSLSAPTRPVDRRGVVRSYQATAKSRHKVPRHERPSTCSSDSSGNRMDAHYHSHLEPAGFLRRGANHRPPFHTNRVRFERRMACRSAVQPRCAAALRSDSFTMIALPCPAGVSQRESHGVLRIKIESYSVLATARGSSTVGSRWR
jgi:hypothetical protein